MVSPQQIQERDRGTKRTQVRKCGSVSDERIYLEDTAPLYKYNLTEHVSNLECANQPAQC